MEKIEFYRHHLEEEDKAKVREVLDSLFLTTGNVTADFEKKFSEYTGLPSVVGLTSCTAALHLSLLALGIGPGDEVITTPMTFLATATAILHTGAKPVFADVEPETGLIDPFQVEKAITSRTRAILPVHLYGTMADMKSLSRIAKKHHLKIIEDCAHCIEGERDGIRPGGLGDIACYSFYATKNLTSGEGGAIATRDETLAKKIRSLRLHGMTSDAASRYHGLYKHYDMELLGWKYNMDNIHAALLVTQIQRLERYWQERDRLAQLYEKRLEEIPGVRLPKVTGKSARHLQTFWVEEDRRELVLQQMQERGIGVAVNYRAMHTLQYFRATFGFQPSDYPIALRIGLQTISLPLYPKLGEAALNYVMDCLREIMTESRLKAAPPELKRGQVGNLGAL